MPKKRYRGKATSGIVDDNRMKASFTYEENEHGFRWTLHVTADYGWTVADFNEWRGRPDAVTLLAKLEMMAGLTLVTQDEIAPF